ncbi:MAG: hypothetical protein ACK5YO_23390, partial [Planctomyces sp.]
MPKYPDFPILTLFHHPRAVVSFVQGRTLEDYLGDLLLRSAVERIDWVRIPKHSGSLWSTPSFVL